MAMIGAIVLARRDVLIPLDEANDINNQKSLTEKKIPLLSKK